MHASNSSRRSFCKKGQSRSSRMQLWNKSSPNQRTKESCFLLACAQPIAPDHTCKCGGLCGVLPPTRWRETTLKGSTYASFNAHSTHTQQTRACTHACTLVYNYTQSIIQPAAITRKINGRKRACARAHAHIHVHTHIRKHKHMHMIIETHLLP